MTEIIFIVEESAEGGFEAKALGDVKEGGPSKASVNHFDSRKFLKMPKKR
jgi:hypothetical protein